MEITDSLKNEVLQNILSEIKNEVVELKLDFFLPELEKIKCELKNRNFTIIITGENSRGKSTLINELLAKKILREGQLPEISCPIDITFGESSKVSLLKPDGTFVKLEFSEQVWDELILQEFTKNHNGIIMLEINDKWLQQHNVQFLEVPIYDEQTGQLEAMYDNSFICSDGAIIVVSALNALSLTEKCFIEQRLLAKKVPHLMLVLTRLDQVEEAQRAKVIEYVINKLSFFNVKIPVFVPQNDLKIPGIDFFLNNGIRCIKDEIGKWITDCNHSKLKRISIGSRLSFLCDVIKEHFNVKMELEKANLHKRLSIIGGQKDKLNEMKAKWEDIRLELLKRANACFNCFEEEVRAKQNSIIERLQFELSHSSNPKHWWEKDFPYRLKIEITNLAIHLENIIYHKYTSDIRWLDDILTRYFQIRVNLEKVVFIEKDSYNSNTALIDLNLSDLSKLKILCRVGTGATTFLGFVILGPFGSAISIGGGIITEMILNKNVNEQQKLLNDEIYKNISNTLNNATSITKERIYSVYDKLHDIALSQEEIWQKSRVAALECSIPNTNETIESYLKRKTSKLKSLHLIISKYMEN